ncbi:DUF3592 domain-containing protein [Marinicella litoralis]|uniref:Uncharacterized protein DUF3592 n=1 Tax=Marinicella litoralis TaxID=644220 RepID=A0A4R6XT68_9GAMM|nr:DUF3592 domain-containing protein [Marinicella litoralis]TDR19558.1 uncharacterized protein DUF3592 [Marinicella litoralis]
MKNKWANGWLIVSHWLLLLFMLMYLLGINVQAPQLDWTSVSAQIIDAEVIRKYQKAETPENSDVLIQLVYRYMWDNREYVNRGLVRPSQVIPAHGVLTTLETKQLLLSEWLKPGTDIELWVNPEHPSQAMVAWHVSNQAVWWLLLFWALLMLWFINSR